MFGTPTMDHAVTRVLGYFGVGPAVNDGGDLAIESDDRTTVTLWLPRPA
jgi:hypothetical protein